MDFGKPNPMSGEILSKYLLPVVIGLIMINLGLSLNLKDFKQVFKQPKALMVGLCCQMVLLPAIAFMLAGISGLPSTIKTGIIIIAACPGGATSNLITYLLKGNVALSISMTSINSLLVLFSIPGFTWLALRAFADSQTFIGLPFFQTLLKIFFMILLPTALGLMFKHYRNRLAIAIESKMKYLTTALLAIVFMYTIVCNNNSTSNAMQVYLLSAPYVLVLNIAGMLCGGIIGRLFGFGREKTITLVIEVGIQNSALAITIAASQVFLGNAQMAIPAVIYGMFSFFNAAVFGYIVKKMMS
ncbi:MAG: bile acid:sodium symporter family protein [Bacteroidales bacterium]|nr:bile acid:sodium symporter family protein [Bacteroidales bacterium]